MAKTDIRTVLWRRHLKFIRPIEEAFAARYRDVMRDLREQIRTSGTKPFDLGKWQERAVEAMSPAYRAAILAGGRQFLTGTLTVRRKLAESMLTKAAKRRSRDVVLSLESQFAERLMATVETTYDALEAVLQEAVADKLDRDEVDDLINEEWDDILGPRTDAIALTETNGAVNSVRDYLMQEIVERQSWVNAADERVRPTHVLYGDSGPKPVGFDWATLVPDVGYTLRFPCDPECHEPSEVVNCRCFTVPAGELELSPADLKDYLADFDMDPEDLLRSEEQEPVYILNPYTGKGVVKGDFEGHPFRGNQYTDGVGGAKIEDDVTASYSGQTNGTLRARDESGKVIGYLDWTRYGDEVSISMVEAHERGRGVATALVERLLADNPDARLDWGMTTPDGTKLREKLEASIPRLREQKEREEREEREAKAKHEADLAEYVRLRDSLRPGMDPEELRRIGDRLNELDDAYPEGGGIEEWVYRRKGWEEQPRDPDGKWSSGGGSIAAGGGAAREGRDRRVDGDGSHLIPAGSREIRPHVFEAPNGTRVYLPGAALPKWLTEPPEEERPGETNEEGKDRRRRNEIRRIYAAAQEGRDINDPEVMFSILAGKGVAVVIRKRYN